MDLLPLTGLAKEHQLEWNSVDKIRRRSVTFRIADGDLAWGYQMEMKDGIVDSFVPLGRCDAKDFDPQYRKVMAEVDSLVEAEMKREGVTGFGSCHVFWRLRKEKLKARGIEWRSPSELNPGTCYD